MNDLSTLIQQGSNNLWIFIPTAIALGALHGLEPGHSKTMMAAFIIAVRGTLKQAILLGLAATISHTAVVWIIAAAGLHFGSQIYNETLEAYLQIISAALIITIALWMMYRTWSSHAHHHHHEHHHDHDHHFSERHNQIVYMDDHEREHAEQIEKRFANRQVTTGQIVMFGLTGGLIPCPSSITVLLLCLQLKQVTLGAILVLGFSIGLAATMVSVGAIAALGMGRVSARWQSFNAVASKAPYLSSGIVLLVGIYTAYLGAKIIL